MFSFPNFLMKPGLTILQDGRFCINWQHCFKELFIRKAIIRQKEKTLTQNQFSAWLFYYVKTSKSIAFLNEQAKNFKFLGSSFSFFPFVELCDFAILTSHSLKNSGYNVINCPRVTKGGLVPFLIHTQLCTIQIVQKSSQILWKLVNHQ